MEKKRLVPWSVYFGLETEFGISVLENADIDVVEESIHLVRSASQLGSPNLWDYTKEDPHQDARGFRAKELRQDADEANFFSQDRQRPYSFEEIKSDFVLRNGARLYNDHTHPEYSTAECSTLIELIAQDKAGERILEECAKASSKKRRHTVCMYKNNTDFAGHSYGCHENYLIPRLIPWDRLVEGMLPFLITRQIYAGAGKLGWEREDHGMLGGYQISQRADFFTELVGIDTMNRRPIINTRDEPHANPKLYRRFHVILGDANLSEFSTWLKVGTTALVLEALQYERIPKRFFLADPLYAHRSISRDPKFRWEIELAQGGRTTAIELQNEYADWVARYVDLDHPEKEKVWKAWKETLRTLSSNPYELKDRLDWMAKFWLLQTFREDQNLSWDDPWLQSLDLEYHLVDRSRGLFYALESAGDIIRLTTDEDICQAIQQPPSSSRAFVRGKCIQRFSKDLINVQWDYIAFRFNGQTYRLDLASAFPGVDLEVYCEVIDNAKSVGDIVKNLNLKPMGN
ncbi:peptidase [Methylacidiphilum sp. Yel]|uniref:proteasome accessory factor PafA2 family protein n=1 Tax=Methylacidiphilum sp. Yel TaxID=1847730 RepID=UPI00106D316B|nr:proteasome accessory factor PafA2 family protein [Methylacidiphilum sp. Yel]TFE66613.1 peptidase [Methylacidiphilum sp. Yel]